MNRDEAKSILLLYRHGTADADDPQVAGALALAEQDQELKDWLVRHCARQFVLRERFRQIPMPAALKEQIISEQAVREKMIFWPLKYAYALAAVAALVLLVALLPFLILESSSGRHAGHLPEPHGGRRLARICDGPGDKEIIRNKSTSIWRKIMRRRTSFCRRR